MDSTLQDLSNSTKNTQIGVQMTKLWSYEVGEKTGNQRREVAETEHLNVATLLHDVATFGVGFEWLFSPL